MDQFPQNPPQISSISSLNPHFGDCFFSRDDGLAESSHVFVAGNDLARRCADCSEFNIGETGFGTGLNLLATLLALADQPGDLALQWWSVEKFPLDAQQIADYLAPFPALREILPGYLMMWRNLLEPTDKPGWHHGTLSQGRTSLQVHVWFGDVLDFLADLTAPIDAWLLDGHSPALNPDMWTPAVFAGLAAASHPVSASGLTGPTSFATYTAAGLVKQGLRQAGFAVVRRPGHGRKRHMLQGSFCPAGLIRGGD